MSLQKNAVHLTVDGRRLLVMHGDELASVMQNLGWLAHLGDLGYTLLLCRRKKQEERSLIKLDGIVLQLRYYAGAEP
jgi:UDP-2,3-diacylglucosamine pyrophosphatase LpxH